MILHRYVTTVLAPLEVSLIPGCTAASAVWALPHRNAMITMTTPDLLEAYNLLQDTVHHL